MLNSAVMASRLRQVPCKWNLSRLLDSETSNSKSTEDAPAAATCSPTVQDVSAQLAAISPVW